jgi:hypothetical protein
MAATAHVDLSVAPMRASPHSRCHHSLKSRAHLPVQASRQTSPSRPTCCSDPATPSSELCRPRHVRSALEATLDPTSVNSPYHLQGEDSDRPSAEESRLFPRVRGPSLPRELSRGAHTTRSAHSAVPHWRQLSSNRQRLHRNPTEALTLTLISPLPCPHQDVIRRCTMLHTSA